MEEMVMSQVRQTFNPEFINRLDEIIIFDQLLRSTNCSKWFSFRLTRSTARWPGTALKLGLRREAKRWIVDKTCADRSYGARPLRRALQKYVEDPLSEAMIQGQLGEASLIEIYVDGDEPHASPGGSGDAGRCPANPLTS